MWNWRRRKAGRIKDEEERPDVAWYNRRRKDESRMRTPEKERTEVEQKKKKGRTDHR